MNFATDGWTGLHVLTGTALALFKVPRPVAYAIIVGTEIIEAGLRSIGINFFRETPLNILTDLLASIFGYELIRGVA